MRAFFSSLVVVIMLGAGARMQVRLPQTQAAKVQSDIETLANQKAEELRTHAGANRLGRLSLEDERTFHILGLAVQAWKKERGAGSAPLLAEGVLLDCLSRLRAVRGFPLATGRGMWMGDYATQHATDAARAFDAALKIDSNLIEARMRRARIRGTNEADALAELEAVANDAAGSPLSYLAAVSRGAIAHGKGDPASAVHWYDRALALHPRSTAATIGLRALGTGARSLEGLDTEDLYYTYPCTVLTPGVQADLLQRVSKVVLR